MPHHWRRWRASPMLRRAKTESEKDKVVEEIRVKAFAGMIVGDDENTGETDVTVLALVTEDGREIALRIWRGGAFESVVALIAGLASAAAHSMSYRLAIPTTAWQIEQTSAGGGVLHAYLAQSNAARLSLALKPEHARPLAEQLRLLADRLDEALPAPTAPASKARN